MTNLKCDVSSCCYNESCKCVRNAIDVGNPRAISCFDTCCESFSTSCAKNASIDKDPNGQLTIHCEATKCVYNEDSYCNAKSIEIGDKDATSTKETKCESFRIS